MRWINDKRKCIRNQTLDRHGRDHRPMLCSSCTAPSVMCPHLHILRPRLLADTPSLGSLHCWALPGRRRPPPGVTSAPSMESQAGSMDPPRLPHRQPLLWRLHRHHHLQPSPQHPRQQPHQTPLLPAPTSSVSDGSRCRSPLPTAR